MVGIPYPSLTMVDKLSIVTGQDMLGLSNYKLGIEYEVLATTMNEVDPSRQALETLKL